jgi:nucleoside-diphosphate-sugar epimerase
MESHSTDQNRRTLVFGASGITGWAIMNNAVSYPSPNTFERIIGLTNRPLSIADSCLPQDPRIELHSGIDLSKKDTLIQRLQQVREIERITHVYFAAYTGHGSDYQELKRANMEILTNAVEAIEQLCPKLLFFTLQTGGKVALHPSYILILTSPGTI